MEYLTHQQQQQQQQHHHQRTTQQQVDSMATGSAATANNNNNTNINNINSTSNNSPTSSASASASVSVSASASISNNNNNHNNTNATGSAANSVSTADAATVAIAKDMLQLHHSGGALNHNSSSNSNSNGTANNNNSGSNNNCTAGGGPQMSNDSIATSSPTISTTTTMQNTPPAHATSSGASASVSASVTASGASAASSGAAAAIPPDNALGYLKYGPELLYITEACTIIGRNSSTSHVHFHVAENNLVSRKHFQVLYEADAREFYVQCLSKNGIFVDDFLQRRNVDPLKLPSSCFFRFPSTDIRIQFESFVHPLGGSGGASSGSGVVSSSSSAAHNNNSNSNNHHHHHHALSVGNLSGGNAHVIISPAPPEDHAQTQHGHHHQQHHQQQQHSSAGAGAGAHLLAMDNSQVIYSPLKISIPKKEEKSPYLSPTGTISAANSCPASPRQGFHQNQANYNNYGNNNLQNQDLFQTPSTASYNHNEKPPYSYAQLIVQAISAAPDKQLTLSGIYSFIVKHYPYYRKETNKGWQNSIRHNLSLNRYFIKVARSQDEPGKGSFWRIDPDSGSKLIDHSYKKRRQRSSQGFRPSYGMPRSAPVSPSHMDNSRESSPLHDIVLQSAPGSPGMSMENRAADGEIVYNSQHQSAANNSHNQYSSGSPYYVTNQNSVIGISGGVQQQQQQHVADNNSSGNGVGALIALKRNHALAAGAAGLGHQPQQQQQQQQALHPDIIYEELPTDYSGNAESGDECDSTAAAANANKRPKYLSEVL